MCVEPQVFVCDDLSSRPPRFCDRLTIFLVDGQDQGVVPMLQAIIQLLLGVVGLHSERTQDTFTRHFLFGPAKVRCHIQPLGGGGGGGGNNERLN